MSKDEKEIVGTIVSGLILGLILGGLWFFNTLEEEDKDEEYNRSYTPEDKDRPRYCRYCGNRNP